MLVNCTSLDFSGIFNNLKKLSISECNDLVSLSLGSNIHNVQIERVESLQTISHVGTVNSLLITNCPSLTLISGLVEVKSLTVSGLDSLIDFSFLENISSKFVIEECSQFCLRNIFFLFKYYSECYISITFQWLNPCFYSSFVCINFKLHVLFLSVSILLEVVEISNTFSSFFHFFASNSCN
jgi:hypothetical protein